MTARVRSRPAPATSAPIAERDLHRDRLRALVRGEPGPRTDDGRLAELAARFALDAFEADALALLWIAAFEPELRAEIAAREAYTGQITVRLAAALFGHPARVRLASESPLLLWQMVQEHPLADGTAALTVDPGIVAWLEGRHELDRAMAGRARLLADAHESPDWGVAEVASRVLAGLRQGQRWRVHLDTEDPVSARWFAAALGARLRLPVLALPAGSLPATDDAAMRLHRQAFLDACVPCLALEDAALTRPACVLPYALQVVHGTGQLAPEPTLFNDLVCRLPAPHPDERERLWRRLYPACAAWPADDLADLALCHEASAQDIEAAAASAPVDARAAAEALRLRSRGGLGALVRRIEGSFGWDDLVLPDAVHTRLRDIAFEGRERARVWAAPAAAQLFPYGRALVALFAGAPGTGKTMAAQVIAANLGLDLLAVDLSAVVSKWVGETSQHLQQLLSSRTAQRSVLFFDEADAMFAKRVEDTRDAQDRYANLDSSHLMTALENYTGIVLLASNLKAGIDPAFLRRIRHVVDFPKPGAPARERIWRQAIQALFAAAEAADLEPMLGRLARIEASGAVIKNAALSALFATRGARCPPTLLLLGEMLARELAKEGSGLSTRELHVQLEIGP